jgi:uncharacterized protein YyaL (SSP411 family)
METSNHLAGQKSPYLIQHSTNPVDWYPWSDEAFEKARREDKPIFLSIGYSTCHWCHVMEKESFEDDEIADLLNEHFVSVKVDREERPDIDKLYMLVCHMMTGSGGWPLTIIMNPEKKPFFAATYIPRETRFGKMGLLELIGKIYVLWKEHRGQVNSSAESTSAVLRSINSFTKGGDVGPETLTAGYVLFTDMYDPVYGGFGGAPKFPTAHNFLFLLRYWKESGAEKAREMTLESLRQIRLGGIYDQLGFGFHRYSTDEKWLVPHFEKMLYDQAMLSLAYIEAFFASGDPFYSMVAGEAFDYVLRDMTSPSGGFYSAEDADSEGREGRYYLWSLDEIGEALDATDADYAREIFNCSGEGNFIEESSGEKTGENILHLSAMPEDAQRFGAVRRALLETREKRVRPLKDDKVLTDWNGLMIAALARSASALEDGRYLNAAESAAGFIIKHMITADGKLLHSWRDGAAAVQGNLDDYAFFIWGLVELYEATYQPEYLELSVRLTESMLKYFSDDAGPLLFSPVDGEELIATMLEYYDGALPSGNSISFYNLVRLGRMTGRPEWEERAQKILEGASESIQQYPHGHSMFLTGIQYARGRSFEVVLCGEESDPVLKEMIRELGPHLNRCAVIVKYSGKEDNTIRRVAPFTVEMLPIEGRATAYVCTKNECIRPVHTAYEMLAHIKNT